MTDHAVCTGIQLLGCLALVVSPPTALKRDEVQPTGEVLAVVQLPCWSFLLWRL